MPMGRTNQRNGENHSNRQRRLRNGEWQACQDPKNREDNFTDLSKIIRRRFESVPISSKASY